MDNTKSVVDQKTFYDIALELCKENKVSFKDMCNEVFNVQSHTNTRESLRNERMTIGKFRMILNYFDKDFTIISPLMNGGKFIKIIKYKKES